jgi:CTP:phosphocholine cytidylyltransferase-like protein
MIEQQHKIKRAIIMAAGKGERLLPLTRTTPKPLISVNGVRIIDSVINGLHNNGIKEIYVVVGHLKERFYEWANQYPNITIIENPYYETCNNISSLYVARQHLSDCIILDGDQIIYNADVLSPYFSRSGYNAVWCEEQTDEWLMDVNNGVVTSCSRTGGKKGWQLYSISRWTDEDGKKLKKHLEYEFESGNRQIYWDDVAMFCHFNDYSLSINEMQKTDVIEIDNLEELISIDSNYIKYKPANGGLTK